jgi:hypothetical protein
LAPGYSVPAVKRGLSSIGEKYLHFLNPLKEGQTMKPCIHRCFVSLILVAAWAALACGADQPALKGYPSPLPEDTCYDTVVKSQSFPAMKYPVTIIGAKVHPEEVHVTPTGELIFPYTEMWKGLCVAPLAGIPTTDERGAVQGLSLPPVEAVKWRLVDGYMPGVENRWTIGAIELEQLAFTTAGGKFTSQTGQEPLIVLVRYTVTNKSASPHDNVTLALQFGEACGGLSVKAVPPIYPQKLSFESPDIRQENGAVVARLLTEQKLASFKLRNDSAAEPNPADSALINEKAESVKGPDFAFEVTREGNSMSVGQWKAAAGADLYFEASNTHGAAVAVELRLLRADNTTRSLGTLYRDRFALGEKSDGELMAPGQHSAAMPWSELAKSLPEGKSKIVAHCRIVGAAAVSTWEPIIVFARSGATARFKNPSPRYGDENRLYITLPLEAGQSAVVDLAIPYFPLVGDAAKQLAGLNVDDTLAAFRKFWADELNRKAQFIVPEKRVRDSYRACLAYDLILTDRDPKSGVLMPHPDASGYEAVWAGDGSVSMQALDRLGYHKDVESMLGYFLARQDREKPEGDVSSAEGFFSGDVDLKWMNQNGFVLWALAEHYKLTHNDAWLRKVAPQMIKGCDWIARERARTKTMDNGQKVKHYGLLPKGRPSDLYIWDNWYWTDTYSYMGLRGTADVLTAAGMKDEAARLTAEADDYKKCILASIERSIDTKIKPPFLPPTPYRVGPPTHAFSDENWYAISSPIYMVEAGLLDARDERIGGTAYWLEKDGMATGLPLLGVGAIDPYYVYNQSLTQLLRGEPAKFVWTLYSLSAYGMAQGTYATIEGHNLITGFNSEGWEANRQPHMHSNSRYIDLVRIALVLEEGDTLHLMAGTPRGWLADGEKIEVRRAPSYFGEVNYRTQSRVASGQIAVEIEPTPWQQPKVVIHVRPPTNFGKIKSVNLNGEDWKDFDGDSVTLPKLDKKTSVICTF